MDRERIRYATVNGGLTMSIAGYLLKVSEPAGAGRVTKGEQIRELLEEKKPVKKSAQKTQVYEAIQDYDPVLRSHCRLGVQEAAPGEPCKAR